jgi:hypothetical protein
MPSRFLAKTGSNPFVAGMAIKGPTGLSGTYSFGTGIPDQGWDLLLSHTFTDTKVERIIQIVDWLLHDEGLVFQKLGVEGGTYHSQQVKKGEHMGSEKQGFFAP